MELHHDHERDRDGRRRGAQTSEDIVRENRELVERVRSLERFLTRVVSDSEVVTEHPDTALSTICRLGTISRKLLWRPEGQ
jgi:hypothetical protein